MRKQFEKLAVVRTRRLTVTNEAKRKEDRVEPLVRPCDCTDDDKFLCARNADKACGMSFACTDPCLCWCHDEPDEVRPNAESEALT